VNLTAQRIEITGNNFSKTSGFEGLEVKRPVQCQYVDEHVLFIVRI
jgi:hypothetical protein